VRPPDLQRWRDYTYLVATRSWDLARIRLGRPDLVVHQLGWETLADWTEWPDGTWRCAARHFDRRHTVRAAPLHPGQLTIGTITVWEYGEVRHVRPGTSV
jgi:hypothetical protein